MWTHFLVPLEQNQYMLMLLLLQLLLWLLSLLLLDSVGSCHWLWEMTRWPKSTWGEAFPLHLLSGFPFSCLTRFPKLRLLTNFTFSTGSLWQPRLMWGNKVVFFYPMCYFKKGKLRKVRLKNIFSSE